MPEQGKRRTRLTLEKRLAMLAEEKEKLERQRRGENERVCGVYGSCFQKLLKAAANGEGDGDFVGRMAREIVSACPRKRDRARMVNAIRAMAAGGIAGNPLLEIAKNLEGGAL